MSSPISAQQSSVQEPSRQFETRMLNMVSLLKSADSTFFYKRVTKSMVTQVVKGPFAYALEFPIDFLRQHADKFVVDVTFVMKDTERTWPIKLTVRGFKNANSRVYAFGDGGWKKFVTENEIKVGDILIFNLLRSSEFQVIIGRAPVEVQPDDHGDHNEDVVVTGRAPVQVHPNDHGDDHCNKSAIWFRNATPGWNADQAPVSCRVCKLAPPCPRFMVTIGSMSHLQHFSLAVPGHFWEVHANMLESDDLRLRGPNEAICIVVAKRIYDGREKNLSVRLEFGWAGFFRSNALKVGDLLKFFLVGNSCFTVDLVKPIGKTHWIG